LEASKRSIPEVTDEFAEKVKPGLTADSLIAELRKAIDEEDSKEFVGDRNKALSDALAKVFSVQVPDTLVTNQAREKFAVMMAEMRDNGVSDDEIKKQITPESFLKYKEIAKANIIRDFKVSMATDEIARLENINVPDYQVEEQMESIRKDAKGEEYDETMIRAKVETTLQRQAVMNFLAEKAALEVEYSDGEVFDEQLMQQLAEEALEREEKLAKAAAGGAETTVVAEAETIVAEPVQSVVDAVVESSVATEEDPKEELDDEAIKAKYANMSLQERAYQALKDAGALDAL
jgi:hypothetical protein